MIFIECLLYGIAVGALLGAYLWHYLKLECHHPFVTRDEDSCHCDDCGAEMEYDPITRNWTKK